MGYERLRRAVNSAAPYRKLADLIGAARVKPGEITLVTPHVTKI
jgi:hypothetical protein